MYAAGIRRLADPVELLELPGPRPLRADEVLIEVHAGGVGNWDEFVRTGGLIVQLAAHYGATVLATASPPDAGRIRAGRGRAGVLTLPRPDSEENSVRALY